MTSLLDFPILLLVLVVLVPMVNPSIFPTSKLEKIRKNCTPTKVPVQFFLIFSNLNSKSGLSVLAYTAPNQQFQILRTGLRMRLDASVLCNRLRYNTCEERERPGRGRACGRGVNARSKFSRVVPRFSVLNSLNI